MSEQMECQECGRMTQIYHPYWVCVLYKGGVDPWAYPKLAEVLRAGQEQFDAELRAPERGGEK